MIIVTLLLLSLLSITHEQPQPLPLQLPTPIPQAHKLALQSLTTQTNKILSISFPQLPLQISSQVYLQGGSLGDSQLFELSSYTEDVDEYCQLYPTSLEILERAALQFGEQFQIVKYVVVHDEVKSRLYILGSNSILYLYIFDKITIKQQQTYKLPQNISQLQSPYPLTNIELLNTQKILLIFTPAAVHILYEGNVLGHFGMAEGYAAVERIVGVGGYGDGGLVWVCSGRGLDVYGVRVDGSGVEKRVSLEKKHGFENITKDAITAVTYNEANQQFYLLSGQQLLIQSNTPGSTPQAYTINGNCRSVTHLQTTLYLTCQYQKISFLTEIFIGPPNPASPDNQRIIALNRYYDQSMLEGIRDVETLGYDRIALIGDQMMLVIGEAVNRNTLLELADKDIQQNYQVINSFGMVDFYYLSEYSTKEQSTILLINENSIKITSILYVPPELQCVLNRQDLGTSATLLIAFNTTHCPSFPTAQTSETSPSPNILSLCQIFYPVSVNIASKQYEDKVAKFILFIILTIACALILVCLAFGVQIRRKANLVIQGIRKNIDKVKKQGMKRRPMKKI